MNFSQFARVVVSCVESFILAQKYRIEISEFVLVIAWFGEQLHINFPRKILKFFCNKRRGQLLRTLKSYDRN